MVGNNTGFFLFQGQLTSTQDSWKILLTGLQAKSLHNFNMRILIVLEKEQGFDVFSMVSLSLDRNILL